MQGCMLPLGSGPGCRRLRKMAWWWDVGINYLHNMHLSLVAGGG